MLEWFDDISGSVHRVVNGSCMPIAPSEYVAWAQLTGNIVRKHEYDILRAMDRKYVEEMNSELSDLRIRQQEKAHSEAQKNAPKKKGWFGRG